MEFRGIARPSRAIEFMRNLGLRAKFLTLTITACLPLSGNPCTVEQICLFISEVAGMMLEHEPSSHPIFLCIQAVCCTVALGLRLWRNGYYFVLWVVMVVCIATLALADFP